MLACTAGLAIVWYTKPLLILHYKGSYLSKMT